MKDTSEILNKRSIWAITTILVVIIIFLGVVDSANRVLDESQKATLINNQIEQSLQDFSDIFNKAEKKTSELNNIVTAITEGPSEFRDIKRLNHIFNSHISRAAKYLLKNSLNGQGLWFQCNNELVPNNYSGLWIIKEKNKYKSIPENTRKLSESNDPYYFQAIKAKSRIWSNVYKDKDIKIAMITTAEPLYKNGVLLGVGGVDLPIENIKQILDKIKSKYKDSELFLLDRNGHLISSTDKITPNKLKNLAAWRLITLNNKNTTIYYNQDNYSRVAIIDKLANGGHIIITIPNYLNKDFKYLIIAIYIIFLILITSLVFSFISRNKTIQANKKLERDLKERKILEKEIQKSAIEKKTILNSLSEIVAFIDTDFKFKWVNKLDCDLFGLNENEIIGCFCYKIRHHSDKPHSLCPVAKAMETGLPQQAEVDIYNGKIFLIGANPVFDENKNIIGIVETALDITDRKKA